MPLEAPYSPQVSSKSLSKGRVAQEVKCISEALYYEASGEALKGQKAVLSVIINRKNSKNFPSTFCKVIEQPKAFSYRNHLRPGQRVEIKVKNPIDKNILDRLQSLSFQAVVGDFESTLDESVLWYTRKEVKTVWMKSMKVHKVVGNHQFLKLKE